MRIYVDTNVIIDLLAKRQPFYKDAKDLFSMIAKEELIAYTSVKSISDVYYVLKRNTHNKTDTDKLIVKLISLLYVADNEGIDLLKSLSYKTKDFEDNLISQLSSRMKLDYIISRNIQDFDQDIVKTITPKECLSILNLPDISAD